MGIYGIAWDNLGVNDDIFAMALIYGRITPKMDKSGRNGGDLGVFR